MFGTFEELRLLSACHPMLCTELLRVGGVSTPTLAVESIMVESLSLASPSPPNVQLSWITSFHIEICTPVHFLRKIPFVFQWMLFQYLLYPVTIFQKAFFVWVQFSSHGSISRKGNGNRKKVSVQNITETRYKKKTRKVIQKDVQNNNRKMVKVSQTI